MAYVLNLSGEVLCRNCFQIKLQSQWLKVSEIDAKKADSESYCIKDNRFRTRFLDQKRHRRLAVFRLGAFTGSLLTLLKYRRWFRICHLEWTSA